MSKFQLIIDRNKDEISDERLAGARIFVLAGSREKFSQAEVNFHFIWY